MGVLILGAGAWGNYITNNVTALEKRVSSLERQYEVIDVKLAIIIKQLDHAHVR